MKTILLLSPYWKEEHRWMVSTVKLAELWQRLGYRVVVACMGPSDGVEAISPTLTIYRRKDFFLPDPWNYGIAFGFFSLVRRIIRDEKPDTIVINKLLFWTSLSAIPLAFSGRRPIVLTDTFVGITWWPRGLLPRIGAAIYAWTLGWLILLCARRVVLFHPQPESLLKRLRIAHKTQVIPTGIDSSAFGGRVVRSTQYAVRDVVTLTYVGRLESVKGVEDFLAAAVSVLRDFPETKVQVVGWFKPDHPLVAQYQDRVMFTGLRHDIAEILKSTDIFVLPSYSEGLSNALQEAMASGCACIASDTGGNRYLIRNGISGLLFPAGDREALKSHLRRLFEDPAKRCSLGLAARKRIEEVFDWKKVGEEYRRLFEES
ncbi:MAG: glycosyltransferase family 4 protein [Candidatus Peribacteraceae bacterium]|nr:glycosyltransferase family 4 protein [Candidatus Peribacteraceae bacterium]MDD5742819.1 glycosyltransferase family 4 protein [Candidatus Peribacteraceae bacterium]